MDKKLKEAIVLLAEAKGRIARMEDELRIKSARLQMHDDMMNLLHVNIYPGRLELHEVDFKYQVDRFIEETVKQDESDRIVKNWKPIEEGGEGERK